MNNNVAISGSDVQYKFLDKDFNKKKKFSVIYPVCNNPHLKEIQNISRSQCLGRFSWPEIDKLNAWMVSAETGTFMKWGGLGMVASELPEAFNKTFGKDGHACTVVTPMYLGNTGKKKAELNGDVYLGAEGKSVKVK